MATIISNFHHGFFGFQKKAIRGFYYQPALGCWTEVNPESLTGFWKAHDVLMFTDENTMHVHTATYNGYLTHIAVLTLGNENRKDTHRIAHRLERIRLEETLDAKREHKYLKAIMAS